MDLQSILKALINSRGMNYKDLGESIGEISPQGISNHLNRQHSMSVATLIKYLEALGCELAIRDKDNGGLWVITTALAGKKGV